ncbi:FAD-dependent oxidoreductase [Dehalobacter sp. DCM]|uniref:FAD-dependent oxidoreductase n=1 Tax=Dehalobacter sp. DCM TaxID=2907827 RepID=UPI003081EB46|nr:FAD-dependent oxidoreductase [Dehalobacter sp. DCM]
MGQNQADVVVVGSGATGLAAALTAAEGGAKVILFEKQKSTGGTSNFFEGTFAVESELQRPKYITYSRDEAFHAIMDFSHWRANPRLVRNIVNESSETISWLIKEGVEFVEATINMIDSPMTYHHVKGYGAALVKVLTMRAKEQGIDIRVGTPVTGLLKDGNNVCGVIYEENDEEIEVEAKAVVIGTGGFANNKEWIKKYTGFDLDVNVVAVGSTDKMGDGIRIAMEIGAATDNMGLLELYAAGPGGPGFDMKNALELACAQPDLWVDPKGERFCDETIAFHDSPLGNANAKHKEGYTWRLFDDSIKQILIEKGVDKNVGMENPPGTRLVNLEKEIAAAEGREQTEFFSADSVEELAVKIGVDPEVLQATVDEYNRYCAKGHDDLFAKEQKYLRPLIGPRFYAGRCRTVFLGTQGGLKINYNTEVLDKKEKVIGGLYAGGFDASGMYGDSYCIASSSGLASSFALNSGRIAGKNALKYIGK